MLLHYNEAVPSFTPSLIPSPTLSTTPPPSLETSGWNIDPNYNLFSFRWIFNWSHYWDHHWLFVVLYLCDTSYAVDNLCTFKKKN